MPTGEHTFESWSGRFDKDGTGQLDIAEFDKLAGANGFGAGANAIFRELDDDNSGTVSYNEIVAQMRDRRQELSVGAQQMLAQVMLSEHAEGDPIVQQPVDTSGWRLRAKDVEGLKAEIKELVAVNGVAVSNVLGLLDVDVGGDKSVDDLEFFNGLKAHFGFRGSFLLAADVFRSIDTDGSGCVNWILTRVPCPTRDLRIKAPS